ncbi:PREDICTED: uncharacterized protein LOC109174850 [Ipomoea nil]|uniref:uncharacterized protein LOC109174850 n=1 Tax=Ipomoea nil TaxID=35883 RepID=UPI000901C5E1|nr:PREDICTED: uncharacterized protein LOC109174850 [Ipomoea nil]
MYYDCRYISPSEAAWRIFAFDIQFRNPSVERLSFHLPNEHSIIFHDDDLVNDVVNRPTVAQSMFTAWFEANKKYAEGRQLTYSQMPTKFVWKNDKREWQPRQRNWAIGRTFYVPPNTGEIFYLRCLLNIVRGPTSFDEIKKVDGVQYNSFRDACYARGLIEDDKEYVDAITEAATWSSAHLLRKLFVTLLTSNSMSKPENVWEMVWQYLPDDAQYISRRNLSISDLSLNESQKKNYVLLELEKLLNAWNKSLSDYPPMPMPDENNDWLFGNRLLFEEMSYDREDLMHQHNSLHPKLTDEQLLIYNKVMADVEKNLRLRGVTNEDDVEKLDSFAKWIADLGDGNLGEDNGVDCNIMIPSSIVLENEVDPIRQIVESTFPEYRSGNMDDRQLENRAILAPTLDVVDEVNEYMNGINQATSMKYLSCDSVCKAETNFDMQSQVHTTEFLNSLRCSGVPNHSLTLKVGTPVMLLRNIDHSLGLCNGTRLIVTQLGNHVIEAKIISGNNAGTKVLIPRLSLTPSDPRLPFKFQRKQFPLMLSYAMTINKSQGQTLSHVGLLLKKPVFNHGQLYVAISRVNNPNGLKHFGLAVGFFTCLRSNLELLVVPDFVGGGGGGGGFSSSKLNRQMEDYKMRVWEAKSKM